MNTRDTICYTISDTLDMVNKGIKTREIDLPLLAKMLHDIRMKAQKMENGLRERKNVMIAKGLEHSYQKAKKKKQQIEGVNEIYNVVDSSKEKLHYEFIVKKDGKVVYENKSHGGILSIVEDISDITPEGEVIGQTQKFWYGHDISVWFAYDQLRQAMEAYMPKVLQKLLAAVQSNALVKPEVKRQLLEAVQA